MNRILQFEFLRQFKPTNSSVLFRNTFKLTVASPAKQYDSLVKPSSFPPLRLIWSLTFCREG